MGGIHESARLRSQPEVGVDILGPEAPDADMTGDGVQPNHAGYAPPSTGYEQTTHYQGGNGYGAEALPVQGQQPTTTEIIQGRLYGTDHAAEDLTAPATPIRVNDKRRVVFPPAVEARTNETTTEIPVTLVESPLVDVQVTGAEHSAPAAEASESRNNSNRFAVRVANRVGRIANWINNRSERASRTAAEHRTTSQVVGETYQAGRDQARKAGHAVADEVKAIGSDIRTNAGELRDDWKETTGKARTHWSERGKRAEARKEERGKQRLARQVERAHAQALAEDAKRNKTAAKVARKATRGKNNLARWSSEEAFDESQSQHVDSDTAQAVQTYEDARSKRRTAIKNRVVAGVEFRRDTVVAAARNAGGAALRGAGLAAVSPVIGYDNGVKLGAKGVEQTVKGAKKGAELSVKGVHKVIETRDAIDNKVAEWDAAAERKVQDTTDSYRRRRIKRHTKKVVKRESKVDKHTSKLHNPSLEENERLALAQVASAEQDNSPDE